jgi:hypothetical protein
VVVMAATAQNARKFFEFRLVTTRFGSADYWITDIVDHEMYITFNGWWDELITTGVAPFISLVFFNLRIYCKIRQVSTRLLYTYQHNFTLPSCFRTCRLNLAPCEQLAAPKHAKGRDRSLVQIHFSLAAWMLLGLLLSTESSPNDRT